MSAAGSLMSALARLWGVALAWLVLASGAAQAASSAPAPADPFARWAVVVVAGDRHAAGGAPTLGFDNARHDMSAAFERAGFSPAHIVELSAQPARFPHQAVGAASVAGLRDALDHMAAAAPDGCLVDVTTHGSPDGVPLGPDLMTPADAARLIGAACGARPTVVILSACFSGVFIPRLAAPNRMILTAARRDRTSFGCGQTDRYPYFDDCLLRSMPTARDFLALADAARACVAARERAEHLTPPSRPQLYVGAAIRPTLLADAFLQPGLKPGPTP